MKETRGKFYMGLTTNGFIAGVIGGVVMNAINLAAYYILNITKIRFLDWSSIIFLGRTPNNSAEVAYALFIQFLWSGLLGVIFNYLMHYVLSKEYILNGILYSFFMSFTFRGFAVAFEIPFLYAPSLLTSIANTSSVFIWGVVVSLLLKSLNNTENLREGTGNRAEVNGEGILSEKSWFKIHFPKRNNVK